MHYGLPMAKVVDRPWRATAAPIVFPVCESGSLLSQKAPSGISATSFTGLPDISRRASNAGTVMSAK